MLEKSKKSKGFIFLEIIVSIALISVVFVALLGVAFLTISTSGYVQKETQADSLVKEEFEALRSFRDGTSWTTTGLGAVSTGASNPYYLANNANGWALVSGIETAGMFTRKVVFDKVSRDLSTKKIETIYNQSNYDADTIKVTITVGWPGRTLEDVAYLTNWKQ